MDSFTIEQINNSNVKALAVLSLELWPDCLLEKGIENAKNSIDSEKETYYLVKEHHAYVGFIQLTLRFDYVEGAEDSPVAYIEGMYVKEKYRHLGVGGRLIQEAEGWATRKGCKQLASDTELHNTASIEFHTKRIY